MAQSRSLLSGFTWSRQTLRLQFTALYAGILLVLGAVILTIAGLSVRGHSVSVVPAHQPRGNTIAAGQHAVDVHQLNIGSAVAFAVALILSLALGWFIAGRLLRPLQTISATARDISANNLHRRLDLTGPDNELKELGATLDDLFGRLEASFDSQRHFAANASHEMRTPLAAERSLLQVALADPNADAETLRAACEEVLRLGNLQESLVDSLLTLASSEAGIERWESIDLAEIARDVVGARSQDAEQRSLVIDSDISAARTLGDQSLVEILIANLVDNALHHNVAGGRIDVSTFARDGRAIFSVSNTGPVISPTEIDRLLEPFQQHVGERISHSSGHGLGLPIVRAIADAHRASLEVRPRAGGGLCVDVTFTV
jgi:signal transduction histidine kinase